MNSELARFFRANEPELVLKSFPEGSEQMRFQCLDCDGYRIGSLVFEHVLFVCLATREERYKEVEIHSCATVIDKYPWLEPIIPHEGVVVELQSALDDEDSALPPFGDNRVGLVVCRSVHYESEQKPGR